MKNNDTIISLRVLKHQTVNIPAHARIAHNGLAQKSPEEDLCWIVSHVPRTTQSLKGPKWTENINIQAIPLGTSEMSYHLW